MYHESKWNGGKQIDNGNFARKRHAISNNREDDENFDFLKN